MASETIRAEAPPCIDCKEKVSVYATFRNPRFEFKGKITKNDLWNDFDRRSHPELGIKPLDITGKKLVFKTEWKDNNCVVKKATLYYGENDSKKMDFKPRSYGLGILAKSLAPAAFVTDVALIFGTFGIYGIYAGYSDSFLSQRLSKVHSRAKKFRKNRKEFSKNPMWTEASCNSEELRKLVALEFYAE